MPQFTPGRETLDDGCVLGTSVSRKNKTWYVRMYWQNGKSSGLQVHQDSLRRFSLRASGTLNAKPTNYGRAFLSKVEAGDSPTSIRTVKNVADSYNRHIRELAQKNAEAKNQFILFVAVAANHIGRTKRSMRLRTFFVIWNHFGKRWTSEKNFAKSQNATLIDFSNGRENTKIGRHLGQIASSHKFG